MASNPYINKVVVGGVTRVDLTGDTVDASHLAEGYTAHDASGAPVTGTMTSGGGGLPSPITAGNTPVWMDVTTHVHDSTTVSSYYTYTCKAAGTYRITALFSANNTSQITACITQNGITKKTASFSAAASGVTIAEASIDLTLAQGDVIAVTLKVGQSLRRVVAQGLFISINWNNGLN